MAKGIDLAIAADTRSAMSAINRGLIDPLEDVSELLETVGTEGKRSGNDIEKGMRDASQELDRVGKAGKGAGDDLEKSMRNAQRRTDDAKDEIRKLRDELNKAGRAGKDAGRDIDDGLDRVGIASKEVGGELRQNLGETFSSFRGDIEDIPQIAQDVFGGLAGSVDTLAGSLALAGGAAGIGLLIGGIQGIIEQSQKAQEEANDLARAYIDAGSTSLDALTIAKRASDVLMSSDAAMIGKLEGLTAALGDEALAARALAGDTNALAVAREILVQKNEDQINAQAQTTEWTEVEAAAYADLNQVIQNGTEILDKQNGMNEKAADAYRTNSDVLKQLINDANGATVEVDALGNKLYTLPEGEQILIEADTGEASANVDRFKGDVDGVPESVTTHLNVNAAIGGAQDTLNRFISQNEGRTIKINGRIVTSGTEWDQ